jgi:hypothetical protein
LYLAHNFIEYMGECQTSSAVIAFSFAYASSLTS